jgi:4-hydroxy-2-oxoheptanedioate aldolase
MLINHLKQGIVDGRYLNVLWATTASPASVGIARPLVDGVLVDGEHTPGLGISQICQLHDSFLAGHARVPAKAEFMVRVVEPTRATMQHLADQGVTTFVIPMVNKPADAARVVELLYYPAQQLGEISGVRGAAGMMPCNGYRAVQDYHWCANSLQCLIVQAETREALENLPAIAAVPGVNLIFFGPYDLHASMGLGFRMGASEVFDAISDAIGKTQAKCPKARFGIMEPDMSKRKAWAEIGITLFATPDVVVLRDAYGQLRQQFIKDFPS